VCGSPTATLEVVGNTGNPSSEKAALYHFCFITPLVRVVSAHFAERRSPNGTLDTQAHLSAVMQVGVACSAKGDQIFFAIFTGSAAEFFVVNLKVGHRSA
jgi:hypothetical protein